MKYEPQDTTEHVQVRKLSELRAYIEKVIQPRIRNRWPEYGCFELMGKIVIERVDDYDLRCEVETRPGCDDRRVVLYERLCGQERWEQIYTVRMARNSQGWVIVTLNRQHEGNPRSPIVPVLTDEPFQYPHSFLDYYIRRYYDPQWKAAKPNQTRQPAALRLQLAV